MDLLPPEVVDAASRPGHLACMGEWRSKGKTMRISERGDDQLVLEMGQGTPTLFLVTNTDVEEEVWPMTWSAVRSSMQLSGRADPQDTLYVLELPTPTSPKLFVKRPVGEGLVEFIRAGMEAQAKAAPPLPPRPPEGPYEGAPGPSSMHRSRSRSGGRIEGRGGPNSKFRPGDWNCSRCGFHNFANKVVCHNCGHPRDGDASKSASDPNVGAMVDAIKRGQRESKAFKDRWEEFCDRFGSGFYDPARHTGRFLDDFLTDEKHLPIRGGRSPRNSRRQQNISRSNSPGGSRSRSRSPRGRRQGMRRQRRRRGSRRGRRPANGPRRRRSRSPRSRSPRSRSRSPGLPSREAAVKSAESLLAEAERCLDQAREAAVPAAAEGVRRVEEAQRVEVERAVAAAREDGEEGLRVRLREAEVKLLEEKAVRLREAEQRLDKAIATRLHDTERRFRRELDDTVEDTRRAREQQMRQAVEDAERQTHAEAAAKVEDAQARVQTARQRLASLRDPGQAPREVMREIPREAPREAPQEVSRQAARAPMAGGRAASDAEDDSSSSYTSSGSDADDAGPAPATRNGKSYTA